MSIQKFVDEWVKFNKAIDATESCELDKDGDEIVELDGTDKVALFHIYYENALKERQLEQMGIGNLGGMMSDLVEEVKRQSDSEDWRGDVH